MTLFRIREYLFEVSDPYSPGQVLTATTARVLNAARARTISKNIAHWIETAERSADGPPRVLPQVELQALYRRIAEYDAEFSLDAVQRPVRANRPRVSEMELEARTVAKEIAEAQAGRVGRELSQAELEEAMGQLLLDQRVQDEALMRVETRRQVAFEALGSLL